MRHAPHPGRSLQRQLVAPQFMPPASLRSTVPDPKGQPDHRHEPAPARAATTLSNVLGIALWTLLAACVIFPLANYLAWPTIETSSTPVIMLYVVAGCSVSLLIGRWLAYRVAGRKAKS